MEISSPCALLLLAYAVINIFSFVMMLDDKKRSRRDDRRISEGNLLFAAIAFGAPGVWAGMYLLRHKTQKLIFVLGVPLALLEQLAAIYLLCANLPA